MTWPKHILSPWILDDDVRQLNNVVSGVKRRELIKMSHDDTENLSEVAACKAGIVDDGTRQLVLPDKKTAVAIK